ncbi:unnamed protein product [Vitrella brassicaformis CCMP3155]|uniref:Uncharacterized protein n=1 Tax=Vitrella brassicaformis (strain CCMP3155) TaxID=1169540 RepID=A0A0G4G2W9_VITBC|nr:unnamed protein product [Vitrella brassicaformis CCMP3155]|eukprot:CEM22548.1 unnamed protein product [Vitrella brassicaformis CCMP3155]
MALFRSVSVLCVLSLVLLTALPRAAASVQPSPEEQDARQLRDAKADAEEKAKASIAKGAADKDGNAIDEEEKPAKDKKEDAAAQAPAGKKKKDEKAPKLPDDRMDDLMNDPHEIMMDLNVDDYNEMAEIEKAKYYDPKYDFDMNLLYEGKIGETVEGDDVFDDDDDEDFDEDEDDQEELEEYETAGFNPDDGSVRRLHDGPHGGPGPAGGLPGNPKKAPKVDDEEEEIDEDDEEELDDEDEELDDEDEDELDEDEAEAEGFAEDFEEMYRMGGHKQEPAAYVKADDGVMVMGSDEGESDATEEE